jgi:hypothetical protein
MEENVVKEMALRRGCERWTNESAGSEIRSAVCQEVSNVVTELLHLQDNADRWRHGSAEEERYHRQAVHSMIATDADGKACGMRLFLKLCLSVRSPLHSVFGDINPTRRNING